MKTSVTSYSFGRYFAPENLGYLGIIDKAKEFGFDGIEYVDGGYMNEPDAAKKIICTTSRVHKRLNAREFHWCTLTF